MIVMMRYRQWFCEVVVPSVVGTTAATVAAAAGAAVMGSDSRPAVVVVVVVPAVAVDAAALKYHPDLGSPRHNAAWVVVLLEGGMPTPGAGTEPGAAGTSHGLRNVDDDAGEEAPPTLAAADSACSVAAAAAVAAAAVAVGDASRPFRLRAGRAMAAGLQSPVAACRGRALQMQAVAR